MKDQPWDLNQTWLVGRKWCRFTNIHKNFGGRPPKMGRKSIKCLDYFSVTSAVDTHICGMKRRMKKKTKMLMPIYNVSPTRWPTSRDFWPRNGWDPFAYCDATFGGHYVATIKVATSLVYIIPLIIVLAGSSHEWLWIYEVLHFHAYKSYITHVCTSETFSLWRTYKWYKIY